MKNIMTLLFAILTMSCSFITLVFPKRLRESLGYYLGIYWGKIILFLGGISVKVEILGNIEKGKEYVFAGNHSSSFDIYLYYAYIPREFKWIAKKELLRIPFLGWAMYLQGHIFVEREESKRAAIALRRAVKKMKDGTSIAVFPEGTRSPDGNLLPFKNGAFVLARLAKLPIIPISIKNAYQVAPKGRFLIDPRYRIQMRFYEPQDSKDKKISEKIMILIKGELAQ